MCVCGGGGVAGKVETRPDGAGCKVVEGRDQRRGLCNQFWYPSLFMRVFVGNTEFRRRPESPSDRPQGLGGRESVQSSRSIFSPQCKRMLQSEQAVVPHAYVPVPLL